MPASIVMPPQTELQTSNISARDATPETLLPVTVYSHRGPKTPSDPQPGTLNTFLMDVITPAETEIYVTAMESKQALTGAFNNRNTGLMGTTRSVVFDYAEKDTFDSARVMNGVFRAFEAERQSALQTLEAQYGAYVKPADRATLQAQHVTFALNLGAATPA